MITLGRKPTVMFSCRLSIKDSERMRRFLDLALAKDDYPSGKFRSLLRELDGRLYRDWLGYIRLRVGKYELDEVEMKEAERVLAEVKEIVF